MDEKIIKIYYETFLEEEYDFNGIILTPHLNREEDRIDWEVDNPQKVSVSLFILQQKIINISLILKFMILV
jgi:hypothetical protein